MDKTLLGLFTSFVGRREFALSVVEKTCLEETLICSSLFVLVCVDLKLSNPDKKMW